MSAWVSTRSYVRNDKVVFNTVSYTALGPNRNRRPDVSRDFWSVSQPTLPGVPQTINLSNLTELVINQTITLGQYTMPLKSLLSLAFSRISATDASLAAVVVDVSGLAAVDAAFSAAEAIQELQVATISANLILNGLSDNVLVADVATLAGRVDVIEGNVPNYALVADLSALDSRVGSAESAIGTKAAAADLAALSSIADAIRADLSGAIVDIATKAAAADLAALDTRVGAVETLAGAAGTAADLASAVSRIGAVESSVATKAADADLSAAVSRIGAAETLLAAKADTSAVDAALALKAADADLSAAVSRIGAVETVAAAAAVASDVSSALAAKAPKLSISDAADYAAAIALGPSAIARASSSIVLDPSAAVGTTLRVYAAAAISLGDLEMQEGELYTAAKTADGWVFYPSALSFFF